jgi:hypothetical protein
MKTVFLALFGLFFVSLQAQNIPFEITKSDVFEDEYRNSNIILAEHNDANELLLIRSFNPSSLSPKNGFYIEKYTTNLQLIKEFEYEIKSPNSQKSNLIIGVFTAENNINIVEIYYDLNEKSYICVDNIISPNFEISKKELFRFKKEDIAELGSFAIQQKFFERSKLIWTNDNSGDINAENDTHGATSFSSMLSFSRKNNKTESKSGSDVVLTHDKKSGSFAIALDFSEKKQDGLQLYLFDSKLNKLVDTFFKKGDEKTLSYFQNIQVSPEGNAIYVTSKSYAPELKEKDKGGKYYYEISKISSTEQKTTQINPGENFISIKPFFRNNEIICLGFYSDYSDFSFRGICYFKLNPNSLTVTQSKFNPFSEQFMIDKYGKNKDKMIKFLSFRKVFFTNNNDVIFNAEEEYMSSSPSSIMTPSGNKGVDNSTYFSYDDIVSAKLNSEGDLIWARNINKSQASKDENAPFISYTTTIKGDDTYFFINAPEKIKKLKNDRIEFGDVRVNKSNLNLIRIKSDGDFDYQEILDDELNEVPFMVSKAIIIDNTSYFIGRKGKKKQLLKITL